MNKLKSQPTLPKGVKYALTVPLSVLFADLELHGNRREVFKEVLGIDYEREYYAVDNGKLSWNYDNDQEFNRAFIGSDSLSQALVKFIKTMQKTTDQLDKVSSKLSVENKNLDRELAKYWEAYKNQMPTLASFWNVENLLTNELIKLLKADDHEDEIKDGLSKFFSPSHPNNFVKERQELAQITVKYNLKKSSKLSQEAKKALQDHAGKYGFLLTPFNQGRSPTVKSLVDRLTDWSNEQINEFASTKWQAPANLNEFSSEIQQLGLLAQELTFWKGERLDILSLADTRANDLYKNVAKLIGVDLSTLFLMTSDEILSSIRLKDCVVSNEVLTQRSKEFCLILYKSKIGFYFPSTQNLVAKADKINPGYVLNGVTASKGKVTGKVRLINNDSDLKKLEPGEILVATMTRPEYGAALDLAAAFVTDEGGIMCHAAIISREMGKPCVIATDKATKVLKTGMLVTVDADHGEVIVDGLL